MPNPAAARLPPRALWEQARSAILASIVARESRPGLVTLLRYEFPLEDGKPKPMKVDRVEKDGATSAFMSGLPPADLVAAGYRHGLPARFEYMGPDDAVLFDDSFLVTHCFSIEKSSKGDDSTISLAFEPSKDRSKIVDIDGIVRFQKDPLELRSVEYRYANVAPLTRRAGAGGSLELRQLPSGVAMTDNWRIRAVALYGVTLPGRTDGSVTIGATDVRAYETGAIIERIEWADGERYLATLPKITGVVATKKKQPVAGLQVRLERTPFATRTDSNGAFELPRLVPGVYTMRVSEPLLMPYGLETHVVREVRVANGTAVVDTIEMERREVQQPTTDSRLLCS